MRQKIIKIGKGLLWKVEHPIGIYPETTLYSLLKLCKEK